MQQSLADEKHRMLYQGQDPCQPDLQQRRSMVAAAQLQRSNSAVAATPTASVEAPQPQHEEGYAASSLPPTYDDAIAAAAAHSYGIYGFTALNAAQRQRRRTFFAEPRHYRAALPYLLELQPPPTPTPTGSIAVTGMLPGQARPRLQLLATSQSQQAMPQVRTFFTLAPQPKLGAEACAIVCPACGQHGITRLQRSPNARTHSWAMWLCSFGWCCCACVCPYIFDCCRTTNHFCAECQTFLGAHYPKDCFQ